MYVLVTGTFPGQWEAFFHTDEDAMRRGYEIGRKHLVDNGVYQIIPFERVQWTDLAGLRD